jgi:predicted phosphodiesterase
VLKIVVTHHPLIWPADPALPGATHGGPAAVRKLISAGADLFLAGHLHVMRDTMEKEGERKALLVTGGTLCTRLRGDPQGFNIIEREGDNVCIKRYAITVGEASLIATRRASLDVKGLVMADDAGGHENAAGEPAALPV